jgi:hypothetical protein
VIADAIGNRVDARRIFEVDCQATGSPEHARI